MPYLLRTLIFSTARLSVYTCVKEISIFCTLLPVDFLEVAKLVNNAMQAWHGSSRNTLLFSTDQAVVDDRDFILISVDCTGGMSSHRSSDRGKIFLMFVIFCFERQCGVSFVEQIRMNSCRGLKSDLYTAFGSGPRIYSETDYLYGKYFRFNVCVCFDFRRFPFAFKLSEDSSEDCAVSKVKVL